MQQIFVVVKLMYFQNITYENCERIYYSSFNEEYWVKTGMDTYIVQHISSSS